MNNRKPTLLLLTAGATLLLAACTSTANTTPTTSSTPLVPSASQSASTPLETSSPVSTPDQSAALKYDFAGTGLPTRKTVGLKLKGSSSKIDTGDLYKGATNPPQLFKVSSKCVVLYATSSIQLGSLTASEQEAYTDKVFSGFYSSSQAVGKEDSGYSYLPTNETGQMVQVKTGKFTLESGAVTGKAFARVFSNGKTFIYAYECTTGSTYDSAANVTILTK